MYQIWIILKYHFEEVFIFLYWLYYCDVVLHETNLFFLYYLNIYCKHASKNVYLETVNGPRTNVT